MTLERDNINPPHPSHRADSPYDWRADEAFPVHGLNRIAGSAVLFAVTTGLVLLAGLVGLVYGFVRDTTGVTWAGAGLVAAGCAGLYALWVRGRE